MALTDSATGMEALRTVEEGLGTVGQEIRKVFHKVPYHGAGAGFALGLGAAMLVGVAGWRLRASLPMVAIKSSLTANR